MLLLYIYILLYGLCRRTYNQSVINVVVKLIVVINIAIMKTLHVFLSMGFAKLVSFFLDIISHKY